jgi:hypothetical protein
MTETNINIGALPLARNEYQTQLTTFLQPLIRKGFWSMYNTSRSICETERTPHLIYKKFQLFVRGVLNWSNLTVEEETENIKSKVYCLNDLITVIFVGNVKILASIRLKGKHNNIKVKVPSCEKFIHVVYINTAKRIFYNPTLFDHTLKKVQDNSNMDIVDDYIAKSITETISSMLPIKDILEEYLGDVFADSESEESENESELGSEGYRSLYGDEIRSDSDSEPEIKTKNIRDSGHLINFENKVPEHNTGTEDYDQFKNDASSDSEDNEENDDSEDNEDNDDSEENDDNDDNDENEENNDNDDNNDNSNTQVPEFIGPDVNTHQNQMNIPNTNTDQNQMNNQMNIPNTHQNQMNNQMNIPNTHQNQMNIPNTQQSSNFANNAFGIDAFKKPLGFNPNNNFKQRPNAVPDRKFF